MYYSLISEKAIMLEKSYYLSIILQAKKIEDSGVTVIKLSSGDPGFNTPKSILMSASLSLDKCINEYTSVRGKTELLNSVQIRLNKALGLYYELDQIISTIGVKGALSLAFDSLINPGDKVLLFAPYWINYITQIKIAGGIPIVVYGDHKNNYLPNLQEFKKIFNKNIKIVLLNTPNNPSGYVMNKQHLISIMKIIENSAATVISDEIYMYLLFDGLKHVSFASISQNAYKRTLVLTGVSKSYLMPGWRVGIAAGPKKIINAMSNIQRERYSCITNIAQSTAAFAFRESSSVKYEMNYIKQIYFKRRSLLEQLISILPNIKWCKPSGTFFALLDFSVWINILSNSNHNIKNDIDLSYRFLNDINVLVFPGSLFGAKNTIRVSLASTSKDLIEGLNRILKWFKLLK